tara:strand:+ start:338 stop:2341 length:2004 start_codon:yes stop_codon:yes gene_type:complete
MNVKIYVNVIIPIPISNDISYVVPNNLIDKIEIGKRVLVPFGKTKTRIAFIKEILYDTNFDFELKEILEVLDDYAILSHKHLEFWSWISKYYLTPIGIVMKMALLSTLLKKENIHFDSNNRINRFFNNENILSQAQQIAYNEIKNNFKRNKTVLLKGVTSSGKTEIYKKLIFESLKLNKQVLFLLPEIAIATQMVERLFNVFGDSLLVYHSKKTTKERLNIWGEISNSKKGNVIIGTRSAIFLPFSKLDLIIVDEEHDSSFKETNKNPRFNARDCVTILSNIMNSKLLIGSATPSIESFYNTKINKYSLVELNERYQKIPLPSIEIIDLKKIKKENMKGFFSSNSITEINSNLLLNRQVLVLLNRRGFSRVKECKSCGYISKCRKCDVTLIYHKIKKIMSCHYCGYFENYSNLCNSCGSSSVNFKGGGTEKVEHQLIELFPNHVIDRMDYDSTMKKGSYKALMNRFSNLETHILIGTQMISKGLDFSNVGLVIVLNADSHLSFPDFRSFEKTYQILTQVTGRAGRKSYQGKVLVQTYNSELSVINDFENQNFLDFYNSQIKEREEFNYPPFLKLIKIEFYHKNVSILNQSAKLFTDKLKRETDNEILGPEFGVIDRLNNYYFKSTLVKSKKGKSLILVKKSINDISKFIKNQKKYKNTKIVIDVDPC